MAKTSVYLYSNQVNIQNALSSILGKNVEVFKKKSGAPYVKGENVFISISHKKNYVAIAVSDNPVGVDIEKIEKRAVVFKIAKKYFGESIENGDYEGFYVAWTKKEALGKLHEKGITKAVLSLNTAKVSFVEPDGSILYFRHFMYEDFIITCCDTYGDVEFVVAVHK